MSPRPRTGANKHLPQNLYFDARRSTYRYRRPTDGKWFQFGSDRIRAIDAAKQLNLEFMRGADLVGAVLGNTSGQPEMPQSLRRYAAGTDGRLGGFVAF